MNPEEHADGGLDLYDDILVEDLKCQQESLHEVQIKYQESLRRIAVLEETARQNETDMVNLKKKNTYLMKNISVLYKTACTELERKKEVIEKLRKQLATGFDYDYNEDCSRRLPPYHHSNVFDPQNPEDRHYNDEIFASYENTGWEAEDNGQHFSNSPIFYSPHTSNYPHPHLNPNIPVASPNIADIQPTHSPSNPDAKERSGKHSSHLKRHKNHSVQLSESSLGNHRTPHVRNMESQTNHRDSSSHASRPRYAGEHTPHLKQIESSTPQSKQHSSSRISSRKQSGTTSSHSKHLRSETSQNTHSDKRSSSYSKHSHLDSRKSHDHRSGDRSSEPHLLKSKCSESKKSSHSSRIKSKVREPSSSSSSSSRSRHRTSQTAEKGDPPRSEQGPHASCDSSSKYQDDESVNKPKRMRTAPVKKGEPKEKKSTSTKRKLPKEFSISGGSRSKRKHKERNTHRDSKPEPLSDIHVVIKKEKDPLEENPEFKPLLLSDKKIKQEENVMEYSDHHDFRDNSLKESPNDPCQNWVPDDKEDIQKEISKNVELQNGSQQTIGKLQSVTGEPEVDEATTAELKSTSSSPENSSHESDVADTEGDCEKDFDADLKQLDTEVNRSCSSILWASKNLSDSDDNSVCPDDDDGSASEADKPELFSPPPEARSKKEQSSVSSETSDRSDSSSDHKNSSIVIRCFGTTNQDDSRSPIIIPCYSSKKSCSSVSDTDDDCDSGVLLTSTPSNNLIARSLFPVDPCVPEKSPIASEGCILLNTNTVSNLNNSEICRNDSETLVKVNPDDASEESSMSDGSAGEPPNSWIKTECDNNSNFRCSPNLHKESDDPDPITNVVESVPWQAESNEHQVEEDEHSGHSGSDQDDANHLENEDEDNNNNDDDDDIENSSNQMPITGSVDESKECLDDELEEGELLTDEEFESVETTDSVVPAPATATIAIVSPVRYKSVSHSKSSKGSTKHYREVYHKRPHRDPKKSYAHNRQRSSPDRFGCTYHYSAVREKRSRHGDGRNGRSRGHLSGSGPRGQSGWQDSHHRQSGFHHIRSNRDRKRRMH